jgi:hypothetical protein
MAILWTSILSTSRRRAVSRSTGNVFRVHINEVRSMQSVAL